MVHSAGQRILCGSKDLPGLGYLHCSLVWIDTLCISQTDIPERNRQLRIMPHIYMRAQTVKVWLGKQPAYDHCDAVLWTYVGLWDRTDARGFSMDYKKSLFEV
jgi:hypothetical protein